MGPAASEESIRLPATASAQQTTIGSMRDGNLTDRAGLFPVEDGDGLAPISRRSPRRNRPCSDCWNATRGRTSCSADRCRARPSRQDFWPAIRRVTNAMKILTRQRPIS